MKVCKALLTYCCIAAAVFVFTTHAVAQPPEVIAVHNLLQAVERGDMEKVKALIDGGTDVNGQFNGRNALHTACRQDSSEMVELLISKGADVNAKAEDGKGRTALQIAVGNRKGAGAIVPVLIKHRVDVNDRGPSGNTALHEAVGKYGNRKYSIDIVKLMLSKGADVNAADGGNTPLLDAILHQRPVMVKLLLEHGAKPNIKGKKGKTPLFCAVENKQPEMVKHLLEHGADPKIATPKGETPMSFAKSKTESKYLDPTSKRKYQEIVDLLQGR